MGHLQVFLHRSADETAHPSFPKRPPKSGRGSAFSAIFNLAQAKNSLELIIFGEESGKRTALVTHPPADEKCWTFFCPKNLMKMAEWRRSEVQTMWKWTRKKWMISFILRALTSDGPQRRDVVSVCKCVRNMCVKYLAGKHDDDDDCYDMTCSCRFLSIDSSLTFWCARVQVCVPVTISVLINNRAWRRFWRTADPELYNFPCNETRRHHVLVTFFQRNTIAMCCVEQLKYWDQHFQTNQLTFFYKK